MFNNNNQLSEIIFSKEDNAANSDNPSLTRRWWTSHSSDLFVWLDTNQEVASFQLCVSKHTPSEISVRWKADSNSISLSGVDEGESHTGKHKGSPLLVNLPNDDKKSEIIERALETFSNESKFLPAFIRDCVLESLTANVSAV